MSFAENFIQSAKRKEQAQPNRSCFKLIVE